MPKGESPRIGYIGLGLMGGSMTARLLDRGFTVTIWNRTEAKMRPFLKRGAQAGLSAADVTRKSDIVHLCLLDTAAVEEVVFGSTGVAAGASTDKILVDHSTISPNATRRMAARLKCETGMAWVDAPVTGGTIAATEGNLVIMAGGEPDAVERVRPIAGHLSQRFAHMGPQGAGQVTKLCNNVAVSCLYCVIAEMVALARNAGIMVEKLPETVEGGFGDSRIMQVMGPRMIARNFAPIGHISTMLKDLRLLDELAASTRTAIPMSGMATQLYRLHEAKGHGELDNTSVIMLWDADSG